LSILLYYLQLLLTLLLLLSILLLCIVAVFAPTRCGLRVLTCRYHSRGGPFFSPSVAVTRILRRTPTLMPRRDVGSPRVFDRCRRSLSPSTRDDSPPGGCLKSSAHPCRLYVLPKTQFPIGHPAFVDCHGQAWESHGRRRMRLLLRNLSLFDLAVRRRVVFFPNRCVFL